MEGFSEIAPAEKHWRYTRKFVGQMHAVPLRQVRGMRDYLMWVLYSIHCRRPGLGAMHVQLATFTMGFQHDSLIYVPTQVCTQTAARPSESAQASVGRRRPPMLSDCQGTQNLHAAMFVDVQAATLVCFIQAACRACKLTFSHAPFSPCRQLLWQLYAWL